MNNAPVTINIAKEFTEFPGARYKTDGDFSGEEFYELYLKPNLQNVWDDDTKQLFLDLDGTFGYASSFISEVFTRAAKEFKDKDKLVKKIKFKSEDEPLLIDTIKQIISEA